MGLKANMNRETKVIRSTDFDALSCRVSALAKNYIEDPYLGNMIRGFEEFLKYEYKLSAKRVLNSIVSGGNKMPVINRGTYIRTRSIDLVVAKFLDNFKGGKKRIVNLGAGSDTRVFKVLDQNSGDDGLEYVELDFGASTKLKHAVIKTDSELAKLVGLETAERPEDLEKFYTTLDNSLILEKYKLIGIDLRNNDKVQELLSHHFDPVVPTLVVSECMLCYTESKDSKRLIETLCTFFDRIALLIYDPIGGSDKFGDVMMANLKIRNINMPSVLEFNTLEKYSQRLVHLGFEDVKSANMYTVLNSWTDVNEQRRVSKLEFLDEMEELKLLLEHYCIFIATSGFKWRSLNLNFDLEISV